MNPVSLALALQIVSMLNSIIPFVPSDLFRNFELPESLEFLDAYIRKRIDSRISGGRGEILILILPEHPP